MYPSPINNIAKKPTSFTSADAILGLESWISASHRTVGVGRDLGRPYGPYPLLRAPQSRVPSTTSRWLLKIPKEKSTTCLGSPWQRSITCAVRKCSLMLRQDVLCSSSCRLWAEFAKVPEFQHLQTKKNGQTKQIPLWSQHPLYIIAKQH